MTLKSHAFLWVAVVVAASSTLQPQAGPTKKSENMSSGIWKAAVPRHKMRGEFMNHDPIGLAAGVAIKTDCSVNWIDPDTQRRYCFNSPTSLLFFKRWPKRNSARARSRWKAMQPMH